MKRWKRLNGARKIFQQRPAHPEPLESTVFLQAFPTDPHNFPPQHAVAFRFIRLHRGIQGKPQSSIQSTRVFLQEVHSEMGESRDGDERKVNLWGKRSLRLSGPAHLFARNLSYHHQLSFPFMSSASLSSRRSAPQRDPPVCSGIETARRRLGVSRHLTPQLHLRAREDQRGTTQSKTPTDRAKEAHQQTDGLKKRASDTGSIR